MCEAVMLKNTVVRYVFNVRGVLASLKDLARGQTIKLQAANQSIILALIRKYPQ